MRRAIAPPSLNVNRVHTQAALALHKAFDLLGR
jgi:hypothetical protein